jgi:hypothetical protein
MKAFIIATCSFFLFSCRKENTDLGPDYPHLFGKWENIGPSDDRTRVEFFKNGLIKISKSTERMKNFKVDNYEFSPASPKKINYFSSKSNYNKGYRLLVDFTWSPIYKYDTIKMYIGRQCKDFLMTDNYSPTFIKIE